ncbi:MAG: Glycine-tRNA ligase [Candidatus Roizmanbacteria bacterium GW2011_GWA2_35_8]|uniref:Glycine-tRNA ligase n=1 Tax=Candidatus Roizmanbacteria bacterium GW2011_GWA2_35_8 TaxID=1618479 RepID=A0A0G0FGF9_9BACT|nr:MAG: Glycine-tRNA ligase [Candidatus Roizmanbacteria bacterium GW2011_GWA2_35_8]
MNIMEPIIALCKRRGFFYPSSEIYGGLANTWDFGHYGILLKNNLRDFWWKKFVLQRSDIVGVDASTILPPKVWEASGHLTGFNDALVDCRNCHFRRLMFVNLIYFLRQRLESSILTNQRPI